MLVQWFFPKKAFARIELWSISGIVNENWTENSCCLISSYDVRPTDLLCDLAFKHIPAQVVAHVGSIYAGFCRFAFLYPWLYLNSWPVENTVVGLDLCFLYCVFHPSFMNLLTELLSLLHIIIIMQVTGYKPSCWAVGMSLGFLVLPPGMSWQGQPYLAQTWYL